METRWKPGQSGNPSGRAKGSLGVSEAVGMILRGRKRCPRESARVSWNLAVAWIARARHEDAALSMLLDRTEGKVAVPMDHHLSVDINRAISEAHAAALLEGTPAPADHEEPPD